MLRDELGQLRLHVIKLRGRKIRGDPQEKRGPRDGHGVVEVVRGSQVGIGRMEQEVAREIVPRLDTGGFQELCQFLFGEPAGGDGHGESEPGDVRVGVYFGQAEQIRIL